MRRQKLNPSRKQEVVGWKVTPRAWWPELTGKMAPEFATIHEMRKWQEAQNSKSEGKDSRP